MQPLPEEKVLRREDQLTDISNIPAVQAGEYTPHYNVFDSIKGGLTGLTAMIPTQIQNENIKPTGDVAHEEHHKQSLFSKLSEGLSHLGADLKEKVDTFLGAKLAEVDPERDLDAELKEQVKKINHDILALPKRKEEVARLHPHGFSAGPLKEKGLPVKSVPVKSAPVKVEEKVQPFSYKTSNFAHSATETPGSKDLMEKSKETLSTFSSKIAEIKKEEQSIVAKVEEGFKSAVNTISEKVDEAKEKVFGSEPVALKETIKEKIAETQERVQEATEPKEDQFRELETNVDEVEKITRPINPSDVIGFHEVTDGFKETVAEFKHEHRIEELDQKVLHHNNPFEVLEDSETTHTA